jgi:hypothetical protein
MRFGNKFIIDMATSILAEKFDLSAQYKGTDNNSMLGIKYHRGSNKFEKSLPLNNSNYLDYLNSQSVSTNFHAGHSEYLQSKHVTNIINQYLNSDPVRNKIINNNEFKSRYNNNNDCVVHIRLGDVAHLTPGFCYYDDIISKLKFDTLYIATDSPAHSIISDLRNKYPNLQLLDLPLHKIILFASTCKFVVLSYGTFSSTIGYFSFYSYVYSVPFGKYRWDQGPDFDTQSDKYTLVHKWIN